MASTRQNSLRCASPPSALYLIRRASASFGLWLGADSSLDTSQVPCAPVGSSATKLSRFTCKNLPPHFKNAVVKTYKTYYFLFATLIKETICFHFIAQLLPVFQCYFISGYHWQFTKRHSENKWQPCSRSNIPHYQIFLL